MPIMELRGGSLADGLRWLRRSLKQLAAMLVSGGHLYDLETLKAPWAKGSLFAHPNQAVATSELTAFPEQSARLPFRPPYLPR